MKAIDEYILMIQSVLPETCTAKDLIHAGLYSSAQAIRCARLAGKCPDHFRLGRRIVYPKKSIIEWLKESKCEHLYPKETNAEIHGESGVEEGGGT